MLCGEFYSSSVCLHLRLVNSSDTYSAYSSLLTLIQMASVTANKMNDEEDVYLENGLLSYENPNYHMDPAYIYDEINSNTRNSYETNNQQNVDGTENYTKTLSAEMPHRKTYASMNISMMGVDISTDKVTKNNSNLKINERSSAKKGLLLNENISNELSQEWNSKLFSCESNENFDAISNSNISTDIEEKGSQPLAAGWERHEDSEGVYYWHIKTGTIQREIPKFSGNSLRNKKISEDDISYSYVAKPGEALVTRSNTSSALDSEIDDYKWKEKYAFKRRSYPSKSDFDRKELPIRFAVRSLGWVEIGEDDLTPEKSSKAVNKCIVDLSVGKNDLLDVVGRWGDGKDLFMDLDEGALKLVDPENLTILNTQPIHTIRVWGVGRENGRDFAYVARDRITRKHMCHVFRCDMPARTIANTLRDICKKIMIERSLQQNHEKSLDLSHKCKATRPTNLPTESRRFMKNHQGIVNQSFPTPMEEPKKVISAHYLGSTQVPQAVGMDTLNEAIDELSVKPKSQWHFVNISVAPSMITIHDTEDNTLLAECRVRYLSFLGIGKIVKYCAFVMHTAQDTFIAHVFYCEPSSGALCKTIEAACKLRYQKCLDAHPNGYERSQNNSPGKSIGAALKSIVDSLTGRRIKAIDS